MTEYQASERRGCRIMGISRSLLHYCPNTARDIPVVEVLQKLAHQYPAYGFGLMFNKLRQSGLPWNVKRVYRVYRLLKLNFRRKGKKRLPNRHPQPLAIPLKMNHCWSVDFMSDALTDGRRFRLFNVVEILTGNTGNWNWLEYTGTPSGPYFGAIKYRKRLSCFYTEW